MDAAHLGCGQVDLVGLFLCKKFTHGGLVGQVQLGVAAGDKAGVALRLQGPNNGRAHHAFVASDVDFGFGHVAHVCKCCFLAVYGLVFLSSRTCLCHPGLDPGSIAFKRRLQMKVLQTGSRVFARDDD